MLEPLDAIITVAMICLGLYFYMDKMYSTMTRTEQTGQMFARFYEELKGEDHPFGGAFVFTRADRDRMTDLELAKCVFAKDFQYFHDRGTYYNEKYDPLSAHMFNLSGPKWKNLRHKLSPTFTSGKMKMMFSTIIAAGKQFRDFLDEKVSHESEFELKDLLARYTTDVIGICAYGLECNSMRDPAAQFRVIGRKIFRESSRNGQGIFLIATMPRFCTVHWGSRRFCRKCPEFFFKVVRETVDYRVKNNVKRNDFMDLLIQMRNPDESKSDDGLLSFNEIAAQAFVFYLAGFETSSTLLTWTLYELALNQDIQEKGRQHYLDQILQESLRKYPPVPIHFREVAKDYQVPETKTVLTAVFNREKKCQVPLQMDEKELCVVAEGGLWLKVEKI
ncbi:hypothetical protein quinque_011511 [Culex quinquefasciatus]